MASPTERTALYRLLAANGRLLYVGIASNPDSRWGGHSTRQPWWGNVADRKVEWFPSRAEAAAAEVKAIREERPLHNRQHALAVRRVELPLPSDFEDVPSVLGLTQAEAVTNLSEVNDLAAERIVLGSMLRTRRAVRDSRQLLAPADYFRPSHYLIHLAAVMLDTRGEPVNPETVARELDATGDSARAGGRPYLQTLHNSVQSAANCASAAATVRALARIRHATGGY